MVTKEPEQNCTENEGLDSDEELEDFASLFEESQTGKDKRVSRDTKVEGTIDSSRWFTKARDIDRLYRGRHRLGKIETTIVNGTVVYENETIVSEAGVGAFVRPDRS